MFSITSHSSSMLNVYSSLYPLVIFLLLLLFFTFASLTFFFVLLNIMDIDVSFVLLCYVLFHTHTDTYLDTNTWINYVLSVSHFPLKSFYRHEQGCRFLVIIHLFSRTFAQEINYYYSSFL